MQFRKDLAETMRQSTEALTQALQDVSSSVMQLGAGICRSIEMMPRAMINSNHVPVNQNQAVINSQPVTVNQFETHAMINSQRVPVHQNQAMINPQPAS